ERYYAGDVGKGRRFQTGCGEVSAAAPRDRRIHRGCVRSPVECRSTARKRRFSINGAGAGERPDPGGGWVLYFASGGDSRIASADNRRGEAEDRGGNQERPDPRVDGDQRRGDRASVTRRDRSRPTTRRGDSKDRVQRRKAPAFLTPGRSGGTVK